MSRGTARLVSLLLLISGVLAVGDWNVIYELNSICAVKGSTVIMRCSYSYPAGYRVDKAFWSTGLVKEGEEPPALALDPAYRNRAEFIGDRKQDCSLRLKDVSEQDQRKFYFRFITDKPNGKFQGRDGVQLGVTELRVNVPEAVVEGVAVDLTCDSTCSLTDQTFTWYNRGLTIHHYTGTLRLESVSRENGGRYSCAAEGHRSPAVTLNVEYPPESVFVSISPSGEIMEGGSVTLTCSSKANPPVQNSNYFWFKRNSFSDLKYKESGRTFTINKLSPEDTGNYYCKASNKLGEKRSADVSLNVLYPPKNFQVLIRPSGDILEGGSVTLTCSGDANPPVEDCSWFKGSSFKGKGNIYILNNISFEDRGDYKCKCGYKAQGKYSEAATLNVLYPPKTITVSVSPSGEKVEGSLETLTCSSDANPPVQSYSWYREGESSPVGSGQSYNVLQAGSYHCVARNEYGSAAAAPLTLSGSRNGVLLGVLGVIAGCLIAMVVFFLIWRRRRRGTAQQKSCQDHEYSCVNTRASTNNPASDPDLSSQGEDQYVNVWAPSKIPFSRDQRCHDGPANDPQKDDTEYTTIEFPQKAAASRSAALKADADLSVIYSSVK